MPPPHAGLATVDQLAKIRAAASKILAPARSVEREYQRIVESEPCATSGNTSKNKQDFSNPAQDFGP
jgi:hypothetical protein